MGAIAKPVHAIWHKYLCDKCNCEVFQTNSVLTCNPPIYVQFCHNCGIEYHMKQAFPYITYEDDDGKEASADTTTAE